MIHVVDYYPAYAVIEWYANIDWQERLRMGLTHSASSVGPQHEGIIMAPQPWVEGWACHASSMGPRWVGRLTAPQPWMSGNVDGNRLGMGGNAQNRHVCARESTLGTPRGMGGGDGHGTRQRREGGLGGQLMEW